MWLGTLSTVVAVATGMFTLRDQIFPNDAGTASASVAAFETSVGDICAGLNGVDRARAGLARSLARRLTRAKDVIEERNALLDTWNAVLNRAEYWLGQFNGLDVPAPLAGRDQVTSASWGRIVSHLRTFTEHLDTVSDARSLEAAIRPLPAMEAADEADGVTRSAGLTALGGGQCKLNPSIAVSAVTLPQDKRAIRLESTTSAGRTVRARHIAPQRGAATARAPGTSVSDSSVSPTSQSGSGQAPAGPGPTVSPPVEPLRPIQPPPPAAGGQGSGSGTTPSASPSTGQSGTSGP